MCYNLGQFTCSLHSTRLVGRPALAYSTTLRNVAIHATHPVVRTAHATLAIFQFVRMGTQKSHHRPRLLGFAGSAPTYRAMLVRLMSLLRIIAKIIAPTGSEAENVHGTYGAYCEI